MNLAKDERVQNLAMLGGLLGLAGIVISIARSKPVAQVVASLRSKVNV